MRRRDVYWSLFHSVEKRQIDDLRTEYVEVIFEVLPVADRGQWLVWREGFRSWKPLADFPALVMSLRDHKAVTPEQPEAPLAGIPRKDAARGSKGVPHSRTDQGEGQASPVAEAESEGESGAQIESLNSAVGPDDTVTSVQDRLERAAADEAKEKFAISNENDLDARHPRFPKKWEVRIQTGGPHAIINETTDVSTKGMQLRDPLPKGLPTYFNVEIKALDQTLLVICSEVRSRDGSPSKRLKIEVNQNPTVLQAVLLM